MRLLGRGWYESLSGAYEEPPARPVGCFLYGIVPNTKTQSFDLEQDSFLGGGKIKMKLFLF